VTALINIQVVSVFSPVVKQLSVVTTVPEIRPVEKVGDVHSPGLV